jgi:hypothetical protein
MLSNVRDEPVGIDRRGYRWLRERDVRGCNPNRRSRRALSAASTRPAVPASTPWPGSGTRIAIRKPTAMLSPSASWVLDIEAPLAVAVVNQLPPRRTRIDAVSVCSVHSHALPPWSKVP